MAAQPHQYDLGLDKNPANYVPLTPLSFLERTAAIYPTMTSVVYEDRRFTWAQTRERSRRLASFLAGRGIGRGDTVAAMLPNIPAMYEAHFGVPMLGAVLNPLNIRLDAETRSRSMLDHGERQGAADRSGIRRRDRGRALRLMSGRKPLRDRCR
ncbi:MAG: AMP-binding protein [Rhodopseudomonas palustris]|nr:AMP-binding protein [Rhodopseudomonas palustris]